MIQTFDIFNSPEPPQISLCNPNKEQLFSLSGIIYETKLVKRFNALSEFSFMIPSSVDGSTVLECYDFVQAKKLISIENEGYFLIDGVEETTSGESPSKSISCKSLESEMLYKRFTSFKGTYKFFSTLPVVNDPPTLMDKVLELLPTWSIGDIDIALESRWRTFDISNSTVYGFLMNDAEKSYGCIFSFDTVNKRINARDVATAVDTTDIYLSYDNLIKNSTFTEISDEICTALYVYGNGELIVNSVNPIGGNVIYDFTYYKSLDWMAQDLIDAITIWENKVSAAQTGYASLLTEFRIRNGESIVLEADLATLRGEYTAKETELKTAIRANLPTLTISTQLAAIQSQIIAKESEIVIKQAEVDVLTTSIQAVNTDLAISNNFTTEQYERLSEFMYENTYQNDTLVVTDSSTAVDYQDTAQELYDQALGVLSRTSLPRYEFKMDTANYVAMKEFEKFTEETDVGVSFTVNINDSYTITPILLEIQMSYDNPETFSLVFGNRLRLDDGNFQYADLLNQVSSTSASVSGYSQQWSNFQTNYKDEVSSFLSSAFDASKNAVINATNQEIVINENGLRGRYLKDNGDYDTREIWMTNNLLVFTDDNWQSAKTALGEIIYNGVSRYGLAAEVIVGNLIAGNTLMITNENSNFILDDQGARLYNASFVASNNKNAIVINPSEETVNGIVSHGISIQQYNENLSVWENVFYTDVSGNLVIKGKVTAASGKIGMWTIDDKGLKDDVGNYIYGDGTAKIGGLTIAPGVARFTGDLYATALHGRVVDAPNIVLGSINGTHIDWLDADKITAGHISADRISAGTISWSGGSLEMSGSGAQIRAAAYKSIILRTTPLGYSLTNPAANLSGIKISQYTNDMYSTTVFNKDAEFKGNIKVTPGGTGIDFSMQSGGTTLQFRKGILVNGYTGFAPFTSPVPTIGARNVIWSPPMVSGDGVLLSTASLYELLNPSSILNIQATFFGDSLSNYSVYAVKSTGGTLLGTINQNMVTFPTSSNTLITGLRLVLNPDYSGYYFDTNPANSWLTGYGYPSGGTASGTISFPSSKKMVVSATGYVPGGLGFRRLAVDYYIKNDGGSYPSFSTTHSVTSSNANDVNWKYDFNYNTYLTSSSYVSSGTNYQSTIPLSSGVVSAHCWSDAGTGNNFQELDNTTMNLTVQIFGGQESTRKIELRPSILTGVNP